MLTTPRSARRCEHVDLLFSRFLLFSRLYRSLEDYDVVRGIFGGKIGTKSITLTALQAEANSDFAEAVRLYNEVLNRERRLFSFR